MFGGREFPYASPTSGNSLPDSQKNINLTLPIFKRHLRIFFVCSYGAFWGFLRKRTVIIRPIIIVILYYAYTAAHKHTNANS